jgi:hypothetical protein
MIPAPNEGAPGAEVGVGTRGQMEQQPAQSTESPADLQTAERLRDILAQRGITLLPNGDARYTAQRWGLTKDLTGIDAVEAFARQVGAV